MESCRPWGSVTKRFTSHCTIPHFTIAFISCSVLPVTSSITVFPPLWGDWCRYLRPSTSDVCNVSAPSGFLHLLFVSENFYLYLISFLWDLPTMLFFSKKCGLVWFADPKSQSRLGKFNIPQREAVPCLAECEGFHHSPPPAPSDPKSLASSVYFPHPFWQHIPRDPVSSLYNVKGRCMFYLKDFLCFVWVSVLVGREKDDFSTRSLSLSQPYNLTWNTK